MLPILFFQGENNVYLFWFVYTTKISRTMNKKLITDYLLGQINGKQKWKRGFLLNTFFYDFKAK